MTTPGVRQGRRAARAVVAFFMLAAILLPAVVFAPGVAARDPNPDQGDPKATRRPIAVATLRYHGSRARKLVALTFDDGYNRARLTTIYRILMEEKVPATFFVNGLYIGRAPDTWRKIASAGYPIGNHTYWHRDLRTLTAAQIAADLHRNERALATVTTVPMTRIIRPPYGYRNARTDAAVAAAGYRDVIMWDVDSLDSRRNAKASTVLARAAGGKAGSVVLMHAGPSTTPRVLRNVIRRYRARGFTFVTVPVLFRIPYAPPLTAAAWNAQGVAGPPVRATPKPAKPAPVATPPAVATPAAVAPVSALPVASPAVVRPAPLLPTGGGWTTLELALIAAVALAGSTAAITIRDRRRRTAVLVAAAVPADGGAPEPGTSGFEQGPAEPEAAPAAGESGSVPEQAEVEADPGLGGVEPELPQAEPTDAEPVDAEPVDAEPVDAEPVDAEPTVAREITTPAA